MPLIPNLDHVTGSNKYIRVLSMNTGEGTDLSPNASLKTSMRPWKEELAERGQLVSTQVRWCWTLQRRCFIEGHDGPAAPGQEHESCKMWPRLCRKKLTITTTALIGPLVAKDASLNSQHCDKTQRSHVG